MAVSRRKKAPIAKKAKRKATKKRAKSERTSKRTGLSTAEYAKHAGISRQAVTKQIQRGQLEGAWWKDGRTYMVDVKAADRARAENLHPKKEAAPQDANPSEPSPTSPGPRSTLPQAPSLKLHEAQALLAETKAAIAQLELEEIRGNQIKADDVRRERYAQARLIRDNIMGIPARIAPLLVPITSEAEMAIMLEQYFSDALRTLAEDQLGSKGRAAG